MSIRTDAQEIIQQALHACLPDQAVRKALAGKEFGAGRSIWWPSQGGLADGQLRRPAPGRPPGGRCGSDQARPQPGGDPPLHHYRGGAPVPDEGSFRGTQAAMDLVRDLKPEDTVVFLVSGGGSALFECPLIPAEELMALTNELLACGADIVEMNTIRKRLSAVKGGRFAQLCAPAQVYSIVLSDILGDPLDMIASGPAYPDQSTCAQALAIAEKYHLHLSPKAMELLGQETPKVLDNVETVVTGSVRELCAAAAQASRDLGYEPVLLTDQLCCQAKEAGSFLASIAKTHQNSDRSLAFLAGGETVVQLTGHGKGGRNQELALAAAEGIAGLEDTLIFSLGSDGTDGPHRRRRRHCGRDHKGKAEGAGPADPPGFGGERRLPRPGEGRRPDPHRATGTNVNDVAVVLIRRRDAGERPRTEARQERRRGGPDCTGPPRRCFGARDSNPPAGCGPPAGALARGGGRRSGDSPATPASPRSGRRGCSIGAGSPGRRDCGRRSSPGRCSSRPPPGSRRPAACSPRPRRSPRGRTESPWGRRG